MKNLVVEDTPPAQARRSLAPNQGTYFEGLQQLVLFWDVPYGIENGNLIQLLLYSGRVAE